MARQSRSRARQSETSVRGHGGMFSRLRGWAGVNWRVLTLIAVALTIVGGLGAFAGWRYVSSRLHLREIRAQGLEAVEDQHYAKANTLLMEYTSRRQGDTNALYWLALAKVNQAADDSPEQVMSAIALLEDVLDKDPSHRQSRQLLLRLYKAAAMDSEALGLAKRILSTSPRNTEAFSTTVNLLLNQGKYKQARKRADAALSQEVSPDALRMRAMLASALASRGLDDLPRAIYWAKQAVELDDTSLAAHRLYVNLSMQAKRSPEQIVQLANPRFDKPNQSRADPPKEKQNQTSKTRQNPKSQSKPASKSESGAESRTETAVKPVYQIAYVMANQSAAQRAAQLDDSEASKRYASNARRQLHNLAQRTDLSPPRLRTVINLLDKRHARQTLLAMLKREANRREDAPWLDQLYARRLITLGRAEDAARHLARVDVGDPKSDSDLLGLKALGLRKGGGNSLSVKKITDALANRDHDPIAAAWVAFFDHEMGSTKRLVALKRAVNINENHPFFFFAMGQSLSEQGRTASAMRAWKRASQLAPNWGLPLVQLSHGHLRMGRAKLALRTAEQALAHGSGPTVGYLTLARALGANVDHLSPARLEKFSNLLDKLAQTITEPKKLNIIRAKVDQALGRTEQADQRLGSLLNGTSSGKPALKQVLAVFRTSTELNLSQSRQTALGQLQSRFDSKPASVSVRAVAAAEDQGAQAGLALLHQKMPADQADQPGWLAARLALAHAIDDPAASALMVKLADAQPRQLAPQVRLIESDAVSIHPGAVDRALARVKTLAGAQSLKFRLLRARLDLRRAVDPQPTRSAIERLQAVVDRGGQFAPGLALRTLARARRAAGQFQQELSLLRMLARQYPDSHEFVLDFADALRGAGRDKAALGLVNQLLSRPSAISQSTLHAGARWLIRADQPKQALSRIEAYYQSQAEARAQANAETDNNNDNENQVEAQAQAESPPNDPLLVRLYLQLGRETDALAMVERMVDDQPGRWATLAGRVYQSTGKTEPMDALLKRIKTLEIPPADQQTLAGQLYRSQGKTEALRSALVRATELSPADPNRWRQRLRVHLQLDEPDRFFHAVKGASQRFDALAALAEHADLIRSVWDADWAGAFIGEMIKTPGLAQPLAKAMRAIREVNNDPAMRDQTASTMVQLARRYPDSRPLQRWAINGAAGQGEVSLLDGLAQRMLRNFPDSPGVASIAARALARAGQWDRAIAFARQWRREGDRDMVDMLLAQAKLSSQDSAQADAALASLDKTVNQALKRPKANRRVIAESARLYVKIGKWDRAEQVLAPLLNQGPAWTRIWVQVAFNALDAPASRTRWLNRLGSHLPADNDRAWSTLIGAYQQIDIQMLAAELRDQTFNMVQTRVEQMDQPSASAYVSAGVLAHQMNQVDLAMTYYRQGLGLEPNNIHALNNLSLLLAKRGEHLSEALTMVKRAVSLKPNYPSLLDTLATVQRKRGLYAEAIAALKKAIKAQPDKVLWRVHLAQAYRSAGQWDQVRLVLNEIEEGPMDANALKPEASGALRQLRRAVNGRDKS